MADKTQSLADRINAGSAALRAVVSTPKRLLPALLPLTAVPQAAMRAFMRFLLSRISPTFLLTLSTVGNFLLLSPGSAVTNALAAAAVARSVR